MSAKLSTEITHCVRDGRRLLSAFETEGSHVASAFLDTTRPHQADEDGEAQPDSFLVAVMRKIRAALDYLVETDFAVAHTASRESELRHQRKEDKRQLAFLIVALRRLVLAHFIEPDLANLGLQPVNVRDSVTILRRGVLVGERFEAVNLVEMLGKSRFASPIDLSPYVTEIREKSAQLLALTDEVNEAQRATDRARIERDKARKDYDRVYLRGARMFEDLCRFAGLDELAETIRRRQRRPAKAVQPVQAASEDSSTTGQRRDGPFPAAHDGGEAAGNVDVPTTDARAPAEEPKPRLTPPIPLPREPARPGVDPYGKLIQRDAADNRVDLNAVTAAQPGR